METSDLVVFYGMNFKKYNNNYFCNGAFGRYVDELSKRYDHTKLVVPVTEICGDIEYKDYMITAPNIIIQELPSYTGFISALRKQFIIRKAIRKYSDDWNSTIYIRHPNPFTKFVYNIAKSKKLPVCLHLVGDTKSAIYDGSKYNGVLKYVALKYLDFQDSFLRRIIKTTPTLVNGNGLRRLYDKNNKNVKEIRTSSFRKGEIVKQIKSIDKKCIRIIYVGYLRHEKGLKYLLEAVDILRAEFNLYVTIVGDGDQYEILKTQAQELGINTNVEFKGHVPLGDKLFSLYKENDIFVLPSISEGTPRVLLEAMCNGLPIIATEVGGIPYTIKDGVNGLLIKPKCPSAIAEGIRKIICDEDLRKKLISNGFDFANKNTLEEHVKEVYSFLEDYSKNDKEKKVYVNSKSEKILRFIGISIPIHIIMLLTALLPNSKPTNKLRGWLLKPFFKRSGKNLQIASGVIINHINNISVGDNVYIAHNTWINGTGGITLEEGVVIGPYSVIVTTEHAYSDGGISNTESYVAPVSIGKGSWLASHVVITSGITIGSGSIIGAGSVVTKNVEANSLYGGVPANYIKNI